MRAVGDVNGDLSVPRVGDPLSIERLNVPITVRVGIVYNPGFLSLPAPPCRPTRLRTDTSPSHQFAVCRSMSQKIR